MPPADNSQQKKKELKELLKELKRLVAARYPSEQVGSVQALHKTLCWLRASNPATSEWLVSLSPSQTDSGLTLPEFELTSSRHLPLLAILQVDVQTAGILVIQHRTQQAPTQLVVGGCLSSIFIEDDGQRLIDGLRTQQSITVYCRTKQEQPEHSVFKVDVEMLPGNTESHAQCSTQHLATIRLSAVCNAHNDQSSSRPLKFHTKLCRFLRISAISPSLIMCTGLLPQDLSRRDLFEFVHKNDAECLTRALARVCDGSVRECRWRMLCSNGSFMSVTSQWAPCVDPFTRRIDSIVGEHRVLQTPDHPEQLLLHSTLQSQAHTQCPHILALNQRRKLQMDISSLFVQMVPASSSNIAQDLSKPNAKLTRTNLGAIVDGIVESLVSTSKVSEFTPPLSSALVANISALHSNHQQSLGSTNNRHVHESASTSVLMVHSNNDSKPLIGRPPCTTNIRAGAVQLHMGSSPESTTSSGHLSYSQINCYENVNRLLVSQPRTLSSNTSPTKSPNANRKSNSASPEQSVVGRPRAAPIGHVPRSQSAYELQPVPLTREVLNQHNKTCEREYKETWKRRLSATTILATPPTAQNVDAHDNGPQAKMCRPASMPTTQLNQAQPTSQTVQPVSVTTHHQQSQSSVPVPWTPTRSNVHISSVPLPVMNQSPNILRPSPIRPSSILLAQLSGTYPSLPELSQTQGTMGMAGCVSPAYNRQTMTWTSPQLQHTAHYNNYVTEGGSQIKEATDALMLLQETS